MKICEIDREVNEVVTCYSVYGAETIINALTRAVKKNRWLTGSALHALLDSAISRADYEIRERGESNDE